jgi:hypothetical protein
MAIGCITADRAKDSLGWVLLSSETQKLQKAARAEKATGRETGNFSGCPHDLRTRRTPAELSHFVTSLNTLDTNLKIAVIYFLPAWVVKKKKEKIIFPTLKIMAQKQLQKYKNWAGDVTQS